MKQLFIDLLGPSGNVRSGIEALDFLAASVTLIFLKFNPNLLLIRLSPCLGLPQSIPANLPDLTVGL